MFHYIKLNLIPERIEQLKNTKYFSKILVENRPFTCHDDMVIFINDDKPELKLKVDSYKRFHSGTKHRPTKQYTAREFSQLASTLDIPKGVLHYVLMCGFDRSYVDTVINASYKDSINMSSLKQGDKIVTRAGRTHEILKVEPYNHHEYKWIISFKGGRDEHYTASGCFYSDGTSSMDIIEVIQGTTIEDQVDLHSPKLKGMYYKDSLGVEYKVEEDGVAFIDEANKWVRVLTLSKENKCKFVSFEGSTKVDLQDKIMSELYYKVEEPTAKQVEPQEVIDTPVSSAFEDLIKSVLNCK